ncbi:hypothetical protein M1247_23620 [Mycobacterium sp. 21AC1]|uniref:hypothetical protein n=1 Tax=[Mycobacterium] appelbergii TaxID=2939269 RepID=UPI002938E8C1|nr:hypothetical protein [Mycobacterium sp. 21AC1]MDV3127927.1 hypothetical protein [Mycobacterium sp. 21AC1]
MDSAAEKKLVGQILLGDLGALLLAAGAWAYFTGQNNRLAGGFFVLVGLVLVVLAAFYSRIDGLVDLGLLKVPAVKTRRAEKQIELGQVITGANLKEASEALEATLSRFTHLPDRGLLDRNVLLVEDAVFAMATLTPHEQLLVNNEVERMGRPDFRTDLDLRATRPGDTERAYRMHRVPQADIRLWYRQKSKAEPHTLYLMAIEKTGEDLR